jgi:hypothetical protein
MVKSKIVVLTRIDKSDVTDANVDVNKVVRKRCWQKPSPSSEASYAVCLYIMTNFEISQCM